MGPEKAHETEPQSENAIMSTESEADAPLTGTVQIPGCDEHAGWHSITATLLWECPQCGGPRGEVFRTLSFDGSRRLGCDGWKNPCGLVDLYSAVRREAGVGSATR